MHPDQQICSRRSLRRRLTVPSSLSPVSREGGKLERSPAAGFSPLAYNPTGEPTICLSDVPTAAAGCGVPG